MQESSILANDTIQLQVIQQSSTVTLLSGVQYPLFVCGYSAVNLLITKAHLKEA